jgi:phosphatidylserine decarboxylase
LFRLPRRIRSDLSPGDQVRAGERFGLIRFGSRVDVYLPDGLGPSVMTGQTMTAGETVIAVGDGQSVSVEIDRSSVEN